MTRHDKGPRTRLEPEARRAQLLECALRVFAEHGIARATHSQVAKCAGVSVSAVYSYFRTREDLVAATLGEVEGHLTALFERATELCRPTPDILRDLARSFIETAETRPALVRVWLDWSTGVELSVWPQYYRLLVHLESRIEQVLSAADGARSHSAAAALLSRIDARIFAGGGHTLALMHCAGVPTRELDLFIDRLVAAVCPPPRASLADP